MNPIFVYGTLKQGFANHSAIASQRFIAVATTVRRYPLGIRTRYQIPWLLERADSGLVVSGELYSVSHGATKRLDRLEGIHKPGWFYKHRVFVRCEAAGTRRLVKARAYFGKPRIEAGRERPSLWLSAFSRQHDDRYRINAA